VSAEARARFQREGQAMPRLNHPNVVSVFDVGTVGDHVFVAMEFVGGPTLAAWIAEGEHPWPEVVAVFLQDGRGLEAAHAAGMVHRDFKPANVILGDRVRVADFGLARSTLASETDPSAAQSPFDGGEDRLFARRASTLLPCWRCFLARCSHDWPSRLRPSASRTRPPQRARPRPSPAQ
jgi:serine/threonine protein kinase